SMFFMTGCGLPCFISVFHTFTFGVWLSLQNLNHLPSLVISYNSQINATIFFLNKSCPSSCFSFTILSSKLFWCLNKQFKFIFLAPLICFSIVLLRIF